MKAHLLLYPRELKCSKADRDQVIVINLATKEDMVIHDYDRVGAAPTKINHDEFRRPPRWITHLMQWANI